MLLLIPLSYFQIQPESNREKDDRIESNEKNNLSPQNKGHTGPFKNQFTQMFQDSFLPRSENAVLKVLSLIDLQPH